MSTLVTCDKHGQVGQAFSCSHAALAFSTGTKESFFWTDAAQPEPCGWCEDCQLRYEAAGKEWAGEAAEKLNAMLVCEHCFRDIIKFNGYS